MAALAAAIQPGVRTASGRAGLVVEVGLEGAPQQVDCWIDPTVRNWSQRFLVTSTTSDASYAREEKFTLTVVLMATVSGKNNAKARDTVSAMMAAVSDALQADPTLGGAAFQTELAGGTMGGGTIEDRKLWAGEISVDVTAELA